MYNILKIRVLFLLLLTSLLSGCILAAGIRNLGIRDSDKLSLLKEAVASLNQAIYWNDEIKLANLTSEDALKKAKDIFFSNNENQKITGSKIKEVSFKNNNGEALVKFNFYKKENLVVKSQLIKEKWVFSRALGWKLKDIYIIN